LGAGIFMFQIAFASLWFRYFEYGPVEWAWRVLTYFKIINITRQHRTAIESGPSVIS
jgi:uncharacterized membrane protein YeiB